MAKVVSYFQRRGLQLFQFTRPRLEMAWKYAKVEMRPPSPREIPEAQAAIERLVTSAKTGGYRNLTVKEAWLNTLIGVEIYFWFVAGECIGKGSLVGYDIPGATDWGVHI